MNRAAGAERWFAAAIPIIRERVVKPRSLLRSGAIGVGA